MALDVVPRKPGGFEESLKRGFQVPGRIHTTFVYVTNGWPPAPEPRPRPWPWPPADEEEPEEGPTPEDKPVIVILPPLPPLYGSGKNTWIFDVPFVAGATWALVNLKLTILGLLIALLLLTLLLRGRRKERDLKEGEDKKPQLRASGVLVTITLIAGLATVVMFLATQDISLPMGLGDIWTIPHGIIFIVQVGIAAYMFSGSSEDTDKKTPAPPALTLGELPL